MASSQQVQLTAGTSTVTLDNDGIAIESNNFQVRSPERDTPLLMLTNGELVIGADILEAMGTRGVSLEGPVEVDTLQAHHKQQLNIESASGSMNILGSRGATVKSSMGTVNIQSFDQLLLHSSGGPVSQQVNIHVHAHAHAHTHTHHNQNIFYIQYIVIGDLQVVMDASDIRLQLPPTSDTQPSSTVYEVCICQNTGRIFLTAATDTAVNCASQQNMCT